MASENLGIHMLIGEHALCESVRAIKGRMRKSSGAATGKDAYHRDQDFVWMSSTDMNGKVGIINTIRKGEKTIRRSETQDRKAFLKLRSGDSNQVQHKWWIPEPNRTDCLVHFVKECLQNNSDPLEVMHCSSKGSDNSSLKERLSIWRNYVTMASNKIDTESLPLEVRQIHRQLKKTVVSMEDPSMKMTGRKRKADVATSKASSAKVSRNSASYQNASSATSSQTPLPVSKTSGTTSSRTPTTVSKKNASYDKARGSGATSSQTPLPISKASGTMSSPVVL